MSKGKKEGRGTIKAVVYLLIVIILAGMVVYLTQSLRRDRGSRRLRGRLLTASWRRRGS